LKCSGNPFENGLNLTYAPKLRSWDCLGTELTKTQPETIVATTMITDKYNPTLVPGLSVGLGVTGALAIVSSVWVCRLKGWLS